LTRAGAVVVAVGMLGGTPAAAQVHRAEQDREITYWLLEPDTHQFRISHDFNVSRAGQRSVHNFVRAGSTVTGALFLDLDTGRELKTTHVRGRQVNALGYYPDRSEDDALVLQGDLARPLAEGESVRVRVTETYTDAERYGLKDGELVWTARWAGHAIRSSCPRVGSSAR
jgi:hypothetical protein